MRGKGLSQKDYLDIESNITKEIDDQYMSIRHVTERLDTIKQLQKEASDDFNMLTNTQLFRDYGHIKVQDIDKLFNEERTESQNDLASNTSVVVKKQVIALNG